MMAKDTPESEQRIGPSSGRLLSASPLTTPAPSRADREQALRALHADILARWQTALSPEMNEPTTDHLLLIMGHVNDAIADALAAAGEEGRRSPRAGAEASPDLQQQVERLQRVVSTLIVWVAQARLGPIRPDQSDRLLALLEG